MARVYHKQRTLFKGHGIVRVNIPQEYTKRLNLKSGDIVEFGFDYDYNRVYFSKIADAKPIEPLPVPTEAVPTIEKETKPIEPMPEPIIERKPEQPEPEQRKTVVIKQGHCPNCNSIMKPYGDVGFHCLNCDRYYAYKSKIKAMHERQGT